MIGERLQRARQASGLSLRDVARETGLSHTAISKFEKGQLTPTSSQLSLLARLFSVRAEFFFRQQSVELEEVEYRKRSSAPKKLIRRVHADVIDQGERWQELLSFFPAPPIKTFRVPPDLPELIENAGQVEQAAVELRRFWKLGLDPVAELIDLLESEGVMVILTDADDSGKIDGMAGRIGGAPFAVVSTQAPGDRQRLTLAHELGHLVLSGRLSDALLASVGGARGPAVAEEQLCNRFAGAFLLPAEAIVDRLGAHRNKLEPQELFLLKHEYGLSMQACLYRALHADIVSPGVHQAMFKLFSRKHWRAVEPGDPYPPEASTLFEQLVYRALAESYITESKAAELMKMPLARFHAQRMLEPPNAATR